MAELSKTYEPHDVEDRWIKRWIDDAIFAPAKKSVTGKNFSIVIPPPNVTGSLHMGHALNSTIQDILTRYHRMSGDRTLWVVGTDHAGIATQNVVERQLAAEGKSRFDLGREKFVERVWKWRDESGGTIIGQLKRLGASCDFARERFTMDEGLSAAVRKVFVSLHNEGLIYRGERLINWCPRCHTALSDLEVEHREQKGHLWQIKYPFPHDSGAGLIVATTRPETLFGDVALAVHPADERYQHLIGKTVLLPLTDREISVIADEFVDRDFGTGVVKITPAHDFNDFAAGERHGLEKINILTANAQLNEQVPESFRGFDRFKAREKALELLTEQGLLVSTDPHVNKIGECYRCKTIVEPYLSNQWYVKTKPLAEKAIDAVRSGRTRFVPQHWEKTYFNWMENIQDWCISRQIWWGHQIPAWYCGSESCPPIVSESTPSKCPACGSKNLKQDEDVLDTWFSSALWPFSTLGWPEKTPDLAAFYPTSVLVTAFDIIFFWVARMMMMGIHFMGEVPFKDVHIHALVRDPLGQKMSKSKGNVVDPLLMMTKYGTDAFRFTLASFAAQGRDIKLDEARIEGYRHFCNKIWNASRFAMMNAQVFIKSEKDFSEIDPQLPINRWILCELGRMIDEIRQGIEAYEFNRAAHAGYSFFWRSFCDSYLELSKTYFQEGDEAQKLETSRTIYHVLDVSLRALHPFMPFITEEIWQMLAERGSATIAQAAYPASSALPPEFTKAWSEINVLIETISAIRSVRQEAGLPLTQELSIEVHTTDEKFALYREVEPMIIKLGKVKNLERGSGEVKIAAALVSVADGLIAVPLEANGIDVVKEKARVTKKLEKTLKDITQLKAKLDDPKFMEFGEPELVREKQESLIQALSVKERLETEIKLLG